MYLKIMLTGKVLTRRYILPLHTHFASIPLPFLKKAYSITVAKETLEK